MAANDFAVPRREPGRQRPIESLEEAREWERLFIGEIQAGRDPRRPRKRRTATDAAPKDVSTFLDAYMERCVKPAGLSSIPSVQSRVSALKRYLGELPLDRGNLVAGARNHPDVESSLTVAELGAS
jgi:hypothetical protein